MLIILPTLSKYFGLNDLMILTLCGALDGSGNTNIILYDCIVIMVRGSKADYDLGAQIFYWGCEVNISM